MNLYEMTSATAKLLELLQNGDIDEEVYQDTIQAMGVEKKLDGYCQVINQLKADEEMLKKEKERIDGKIKSISNNQKRLKQTLLEYLHASKQTKAKTPLFSVSIRNTESVNIVDESLIPTEFIELKQSYKKAEIKKALKLNDVPGAELQVSESVTIR